MLSQPDLGHIVRIGHLSQECVSETQFADIVTRELITLFGSDSAVFLELEHFPHRTTLSACTSYGIDNIHCLNYQNRFHQLDPCFQRLNQLIEHSPQTSVSTDQVVNSDRRYVNSEYYQEFMRDTGVHKSLIFSLASRSQPIGLVGLHRGIEARHYCAADHLKTQLIAPYLTTAIMYRHKSLRLQQQHLLKNSILKSSDVEGYLLFNRDLVCVDCSGIDKLPLKGSFDEHLILGNKAEHLLPADLAAIVDTQRGDEVSKDNLKSGLFDNLVSASHIRVETLGESQEDRCILFLLLKSDIELISQQRMAYFDLTSRQREIVQLVQLGFTNPQISSALNISPKTVENHLTQIYAKTSTHNKTSLLRQLHV